jgi:hypothetical protein
MNLITALEIQTNGDDVVCSVGGPAKDNGKYVGWIELWRDGVLHKPMLSTEPVFNTAKEAKEYMEDIVKQVRTLELSST